MRRAEKLRSRPLLCARARLAGLFALSLACAERPWPKLPDKARGVERLIDQYTLRPPPAGKSTQAPSAKALQAAVLDAARADTLVGGWGPISAALKPRGQPSYLLFGVFHDSAGQIEAFRRLTGPLGIQGLDLLAVELFDADGRWAGVSPKVQRGEQALLNAAQGGSARALSELFEVQAQTHYAAWKYGYLRTVMDLPLSARASGRRLLGCDTAALLQERMVAAGEAGLALRDLQCALVLRDALREGAAALLWGQAHLALDRLPRFLPKKAQLERIYMFGARPSEFGVEVELSAQLAVGGPLLVPLKGAGRWALLLGEGAWGVKVERIRSEASKATSATLVFEGPAGTLYFQGRKRSLEGEGPWSIPARAGSAAFLWAGEARQVVGTVSLPARGRTLLQIERSAIRMIIEHAPKQRDQLSGP